jgi:hypothetical protein
MASSVPGSLVVLAVGNMLLAQRLFHHPKDGVKETCGWALANIAGAIVGGSLQLASDMGGSILPLN